jgi:hypothetical protein
MPYDTTMLPLNIAILVKRLCYKRKNIGKKQMESKNM